MIRRTICVVLTAMLLCGHALATEPELPDSVSSAAPEAAELMNGRADSGFGLADGIVKLLSDALQESKQYMMSGIRSAAMIVAGVILLGIPELLGESITARHARLAGVLYVTAISAGDIHALIGLGRETIESLSALSKVLIPAMASATAAMGGITGASVRQVATVFCSDILLTLIDRMLVPLLYLYVACAAGNAVLERGVAGSIAAILKKIVGWTLGGSLALFTAYLSVSGAVAGAVDERTVRAAKTAVSTVVPVVGDILAQAAESVLAGAGILRAMIGVFGTLAVFGICVLPFLRLGIQYLLYQGAVVIAQSVGPKPLSEMLHMLADAFALVLAMVGASALVLIISLVSALTVVIT